MKDTQLYAQILGITDPWSVESVDLCLAEQKVTVTVLFNENEHFSCPICSKKVPRYDKVHRRWRHLDTCQLQTTIEADLPRVECKEHGVHQVPVPWAEKRTRYTMLFEFLVIRWLQVATISSVAKHMNLNWDAVHEIQRRAVERGLLRCEVLAPVNLTIDETSERKGHDYLTIVSEGKRVLYVAEDRKQISIDGFWKTPSYGSLQAIRSVSVDLWKAYSSSVLRYVPDAEQKLCLDRFHGAGYFGKALDKVRKAEHKALMAEGDEILKGMKYDFLRTSAKVDNRSRKGFLDIARSSLKTARAWAMKETAHLLWNHLYIGSAKKGGKRLVGWMKRCRLAPMIELSRSIERHLWMILNAIRLKVNSGSAEGNNSRIQKIKKLACGFRNTLNFKNAICLHLGELDLMPRSQPA